MSRNSKRATVSGRQRVQILKRQIRGAVSNARVPDDAEAPRRSILELLERSMRLGHDRLAILRLQQAVRLGASLKPSHWKYCFSVADRSGDPRLQERFVAVACAHATM